MSAHELYIGLAAVGGLLLVLGMLAGLIHEKGILSEPLFALLAGVLIGPAAFAVLDLAEIGDQARILEEAALVTLGVALVGVALRIPEGWSRQNWRLLAVLLGVLMPLMWLGWFGPIGAAALYYSAFSLHETGIEEVWWVGSLVIVASIVAHGITDTPLTKLYGKRASET